MAQAVFPKDDEELEQEGKDIGKLAQSSIPRVLTVGKTGCGKSSVLNAIVGARGRKAPFKASRSSGSVTKSVNVKLRRFRGPYDLCVTAQEEPPKVIVVDAPGFSDSDGQDSQIMADIVAKCRELREITLFLLVVNVEEARLGEDVQQMLHLLVESCSVDLIVNAFVVFTHWAVDAASKKRRVRMLEDEMDEDDDRTPCDEMIKDEKRQALIDLCRNKFGVATLNFECVFIDNMFDEDDTTQVAEMRKQFEQLKSKIFFESIPVKTDKFRAAKTQKDQLRATAQEATQEAAKQRDTARKATAQSAEDQRARRQAESRATAAAAKVAAMEQFIGLTVTLGRSKYVIPRADKKLQESTRVSFVKELLREKGLSLNQANMAVFMFRGTDLNGSFTLQQCGMRANNDYKVFGRIQQNGGMNQEVASYLRRARTKDIDACYETMRSVPETRMCPNCDIIIKHVAACKHVTCKWCGHEFCFSCLRNWRGSNTCSPKACWVAPRQA